MREHFPFSAIVGQEKLKLALKVCSIDPSIGGILIRGDKGSAKSTAARALAHVLPPISRNRGCQFNCDIAAGHIAKQCEVCGHGDKSDLLKPADLVPVPFINLPLGATEDRVVGSLDFEQALKQGKRVFQPGLLASAHRGILYIDEVNLLADHLVDVLLDVAASGINTIEREGLTVSHPSSFMIIGTMNPEEGDLRPQLLDRFGMMIEISAPDDAAERAEVVRRRLLYEQSPRSFALEWEAQNARLRADIIAARKMYPSIRLEDEQLLAISRLCIELGIKSLRADLVINKVSRAVASLRQANSVSAEDIRVACELALPHRKRNRPGDRSRLPEQNLDEAYDRLRDQFDCQSRQPQKPTNEEDLSSPVEQLSEQATEQSPDIDDRELSDMEKTNGQGLKVFSADYAMNVARLHTDTSEKMSAPQGRRSRVDNASRGAFVRSEAASKTRGYHGPVAVTATIQHATMRNPEELEVTKDDLHYQIRSGKTGNLILFVVDASGSMSAMQRMQSVKGAVLALLDDAYRCRDSVAVIAFRGAQADLLVPPTRSTDVANMQLEELPTGGTTPLSDALRLAMQTLRNSNKLKLMPLVVLLTDGKANSSIEQDADPWNEALAYAEQMRSVADTRTLVVDTESGFVRLGRAKVLADALGAEFITLNKLTADNLKMLVGKRLAEHDAYA